MNPKPNTPEYNLITSGTGYVSSVDCAKLRINIEHRLTRAEILGTGQLLGIIAVILKVFNVV